MLLNLMASSSIVALLILLLSSCLVTLPEAFESYDAPPSDFDSCASSNRVIAPLYSEIVSSTTSCCAVGTITGNDGAELSS